MIWWWGKQYKDKADALAQGAYDNTTVEMLPLVTCTCCGENELDKIKWFFNFYDKKAKQAFEEQQARPAKKVSRAARPSWEDYELDMRYSTNQEAANALSYAISLLEGRGGCL